jgi:hypothetical protein
MLTLLERSRIMFSMDKLPTAKRVQILGMLCEGMSLRAASRLVDVSINTVTKLLTEAGQVASDYQDRAFRDLPCRRLQIDEIWAFVHAKQKNVPAAKAAPGRRWRRLDVDRDLR